MKKIIAAIDGLKYSASTTSYAVHLARQTNAYLVGVFLDDFTYHSYKIYDLAGEEGVSQQRVQTFEQKDRDTRQQAVWKFENACQQAGVNYIIHHDRDIALQELLHESIYADLLVIDYTETLTHGEETVPSRFIRDLLCEVQCPVFLVPPDFRPIERIVFLYDGEPSSVYAIRTFSYVFPIFKNLDTEVLSVTSARENMQIPDARLMKEFMKRHFPAARYNVLQGMAEAEIIKHLELQEGKDLVVLGAYRRGMVSRWFRPSMADHLMRTIQLPLFIAHNK